MLEQKIKKLPNGGYELSNNKVGNVTYKEYKMEATEKGHHLESISEIEDAFWQNILKSKTYSFENEISLFGDDVVIWNLGKFTNRESNIHASPYQAKVSICYFIFVPFCECEFICVSGAELFRHD